MCKVGITLQSKALSPACGAGGSPVLAPPAPGGGYRLAILPAMGSEAPLRYTISPRTGAQH